MEPTEYCSFVSEAYIICECSEAFSSEDEVRKHLEIGHCPKIFKSKAAKKPQPSVANVFKVIPETYYLVPQENHKAYPAVTFSNNYPAVTVTRNVSANKRRQEQANRQAAIKQKVNQLKADILKQAAKQDWAVKQEQEQSDSEESEADVKEEAEEGDNVKYEIFEEQEDLWEVSKILENETATSQDNSNEEINLHYHQEDPENNEEIHLQFHQGEVAIDEDIDLQYEGEEEPVKAEFSYDITPHNLVVFKKHLAEQLVVLKRENLEHDYYSGALQKATPVVDAIHCDICGKCFTTPKAFKMHMTKVHKYSVTIDESESTIEEAPAKLTKKFVCDVCGSKYTSNAALRYHQRKHTGEKPYVCEVCDKAFTMKLFLTIHTRTHTGERPFQCPLCPKGFGSQAGLLRHNRVHTGEKPYACSRCGKCFSQSNSMKLHITTVHLRQPSPYKSHSRQYKALMREQRIKKPSESNIPKRPRKPKKSAPKTEEYEYESPDEVNFSFNIQNPDLQDYVVEEVPYEEEGELIVGDTHDSLLRPRYE